VTIEVLNEIDSQIQAYMMTMLVANVLIALATAGALLLLGVPILAVLKTISDRVDAMQPISELLGS
jgi:hypothetical protein